MSATNGGGEGGGEVEGGSQNHNVSSEGGRKGLPNFRFFSDKGFAGVFQVMIFINNFL